jgi:hypothetical protein
MLFLWCTPVESQISFALLSRKFLPISEFLTFGDAHMPHADTLPPEDIGPVHRHTFLGGLFTTMSEKPHDSREKRGMPDILDHRRVWTSAGLLSRPWLLRESRPRLTQDGSCGTFYRVRWISTVALGRAAS